MQAILMLAVVGVAAAALGTGFLGNEIELWIQQFGVGSGVIQTPIDHVQVDFDIRINPVGEGIYENVADCVLTLRQDIGVPIGTVIQDDILTEKDSELTCKFTDENRDVIAEATIGTPLINDDPTDPGGVCTDPEPASGTPCPQVGGVFPAGEYTIPIGTRVDLVHDVIVVVHANEYNTGDFVAP